MELFPKRYVTRCGMERLAVTGAVPAHTHIKEHRKLREGVVAQCINLFAVVADFVVSLSHLYGTRTAHGADSPGVSHRLVLETFAAYTSQPAFVNFVAPILQETDSFPTG